MAQRKNIPTTEFAHCTMLMWQGFMEFGPLDSRLDHTINPLDLLSYVWTHAQMVLDERRKFFGAHPEMIGYTPNHRFMREMPLHFGAWYRNARRNGSTPAACRAYYSREIHAHYFPPPMPEITIPGSGTPAEIRPWVPNSVAEL